MNVDLKELYHKALTEFEKNDFVCNPMKYCSTKDMFENPADGQTEVYSPIGFLLTPVSYAHCFNFEQKFIFTVYHVVKKILYSYGGKNNRPRKKELIFVAFKVLEGFLIYVVDLTTAIFSEELDYCRLSIDGNTTYLKGDLTEKTICKPETGQYACALAYRGDKIIHFAKYIVISSKTDYKENNSDLAEIRPKMGGRNFIIFEAGEKGFSGCPVLDKEWNLLGMYTGIWNGCNYGNCVKMADIRRKNSQRWISPGSVVAQFRLLTYQQDIGRMREVLLWYR